MQSDKDKGVSRRQFIRGAAVAAAGASGLSKLASADAGMLYKSIMPQSVIGANEIIRTGHIGLGGMGGSNLRFAVTRPNKDIQPIAVCDLRPKQREMAAAAIESMKFPKPTTHTYLEDVMANKDVDAVVIATPDHWHCLPTLLACEAGKDIYCEKPLSTTIGEVQAMIKAVRATNVVFQGGTMQRSGQHFQEAVALVQSGYIGKVARVSTWFNEFIPVEGIGNPPDEAPPAGVDWDRFIGWTPKVPFNKNRFVYDFRWFLDYSGGKITDWGAHLIDIALWGMGGNKMPKSVTAVGGKFILTDNRTTPDQIDVLWEFDDFVLSFSNRTNNELAPYGGSTHGIIFHGALGSLRVDRSGYEVIPNAKSGIEPKKAPGSPMNEPHWENWAQCIRDRKRPICDVEVLGATTAVCHMGTCAYIAGARLGWDEGGWKFVGGDATAVQKANDFAYRPYQNGWSLDAPHYEGGILPKKADMA